jgi:hypothetical protein
MHHGAHSPRFSSRERGQKTFIEFFSGVLNFESLQVPELET